MNKPVLITLTSPSCAGKSYLFNYIRDVAKLPCIISTTTRKPRANEVEGVDYFFISEEESLELEKNDQLAELAIYRGVRYGVTKQEFKNKLDQGLAFLIVEPTGIEHYVKPATDVGAFHLKYYIHTDMDVRIQRLRDRMDQDLKQALAPKAIETSPYESKFALAKKAITPHIDRLIAMHTAELNWGTAAAWTRILFGTHSPEENVKLILDDVQDVVRRFNEPIGNYN